MVPFNKFPAKVAKGSNENATDISPWVGADLSAPPAKAAVATKSDRANVNILLNFIAIQLLY
jgi:hypothetical protein